ncbi:MAG: polyprenyl synthetase family protein [Bacteroidetes bacterium]|nr:MAG: polyprenyl synthetase family protein [Bacteroidota bacterium]
MYSYKTLQELVNKKIAQEELAKEPKQLYEPIKYILSLGGKRIRPVFVLMACNLFSDEIEKAIDSALALEIFHNFTLLHDDIMDNSSLRRNKPTVHTKWNSNVAILSGDAMLIIAYEYITRIKSNNYSEIINVFNKTALQVCDGQQYDMNFETKELVSESDYLKMIKLKTAVLIAASLKIGALIGGALPEDAELLYSFGINIGMAFQIQDDFLDVYGDTEVFGKKTGNDILTNKKTYLLIKAFELAKGSDYKELYNKIFVDNKPSEEKFDKVVEIYNKLEIKKVAENKIAEYFDKAFKLINELSVSSERKNELMSLIQNKLINRNY